ncbi:PREDICTED: basic proline-rich protein-like, partial [Condylura cristata]|uniref:basic proline-rich protein-like n=1 Tax=Condylura cristata TaxID=143302 RepID=UPI00064287F0
ASAAAAHPPHGPPPTQLGAAQVSPLHSPAATSPLLPGRPSPARATPCRLSRSVSQERDGPGAPPLRRAGQRLDGGAAPSPPPDTSPSARPTAPSALVGGAEWPPSGPGAGPHCCPHRAGGRGGPQVPSSPGLGCSFPAGCQAAQGGGQGRLTKAHSLTLVPATSRPGKGPRAACSPPGAAASAVPAPPGSLPAPPQAPQWERDPEAQPGRPASLPTELALGVRRPGGRPPAVTPAAGGAGPLTLGLRPAPSPRPAPGALPGSFGSPGASSAAGGSQSPDPRAQATGPAHCRPPWGWASPGQAAPSPQAPEDSGPSPALGSEAEAVSGQPARAPRPARAQGPARSPTWTRLASESSSPPSLGPCGCQAGAAGTGAAQERAQTRTGP